MKVFEHFLTERKSYYFTKKDLKARGWTDKLIDDLLGPPDLKAQNRHGPAPMCCYKEGRVYAAEQDDPRFAERRRPRKQTAENLSLIKDQ